MSISLPSSTMDIRWPIAGVGYRTIASIAATCLSTPCVCACVCEVQEIRMVLFTYSTWMLVVGKVCQSIDSVNPQK